MRDPFSAAGVTSSQHSASSEPKGGESGKSPFTHPICTRIPVLVQVSAHESTAVGRTERVEAFQEETESVIVFPQGAVVRLAERVLPGQSVALTNLASKRTVRGRVYSVRALANVKGYAEILFTQPTPDFWGVDFPPGALASPTGLAGEPEHTATQPAETPTIERVTTPEAKASSTPAPDEDVTRMMQQILEDAAAKLGASPLDSILGGPSQGPAPIEGREDATPRVGDSFHPVVSADSQPEPPADVFGQIRAHSRAGRSAPLGALKEGAKYTSDSAPLLSAPELESSSGWSPQRDVWSSPTSSESLRTRLLDEPAPTSAEEIPPAEETLAVPPAESLAPASESAFLAGKSMPLLGSGLYDTGEVTAHERTFTYGAVRTGRRGTNSKPRQALIGVAVAGAIAIGGVLAAKVFLAEQPAIPTPEVALTHPVDSTLTYTPALAASRATSPAKSQIRPTDAASKAGAPTGGPATASSDTKISPEPAEVPGSATNRPQASADVAAQHQPESKAKTLGLEPAQMPAPVLKPRQSVDSSPSLATPDLAAPESNAAPAAISGTLSGEMNPLNAPPPPPQPETTPVQVGGEVKPPRLLVSTQPVYPTIAKEQRVQGDVKLDFIIDTAGKVTNVKVISGPPLLGPAAIGAVRHWRYQPTLLNGKAVPIEMQVTLKFRLQ